MIDEQHPMQIGLFPLDMKCHASSQHHHQQQRQHQHHQSTNMLLNGNVKISPAAAATGNKIMSVENERRQIEGATIKATTTTTTVATTKTTTTTTTIITSTSSSSTTTTKTATSSNSLEHERVIDKSKNNLSTRDSMLDIDLNVTKTLSGNINGYVNNNNNKNHSKQSNNNNNNNNNVICNCCNDNNNNHKINCNRNSSNNNNTSGSESVSVPVPVTGQGPGPPPINSNCNTLSASIRNALASISANINTTNNSPHASSDIVLGNHNNNISRCNFVNNINNNNNNNTFNNNNDGISMSMQQCHLQQQQQHQQHHNIFDQQSSRLQIPQQHGQQNQHIHQLLLPQQHRSQHRHNNHYLNNNNCHKIQCALCCQPISDRYIMCVMDNHFHESCLKCANCSLHLVHSCFARNGKLYCRNDYERLFMRNRCLGCGHNIASDELVMRTLENVFHLKCFACVVCGTVLQKGEQYVVKQGQLFCRFDYEKEVEMLQGYDFYGDDLYTPKLDGRRGPKRPRTILNTQQRRAFKASFELSPKPCRKVRENLAKETGLSLRIVQVWFQNQRAKVKKIQKKAKVEPIKGTSDSQDSQESDGSPAKVKDENQSDNESLLESPFSSCGLYSGGSDPSTKILPCIKEEQELLTPFNCMETNKENCNKTNEPILNTILGLSYATFQQLIGPFSQSPMVNPIDRLYSMQNSYFRPDEVGFDDCDKEANNL